MTDSRVTVIDTREVLGKEFKIFGTFEEPLFMAKDVAEWIDYQKISGQNYRNVSKMLNTVDEDEKFKTRVSIPTKDSNLKDQEYWVVTEDGFYEILMMSKKPIAKQFKKQVKLILKEIRKTGSYQKHVLDSYMISDPIERGLKWIEEKKEMIRLEKKTENQKQIIIEKDTIIEEQAPKVEVFQQALDSKTTHSIRDVSKLVNMMTLRKPFKPIGQNGLFRILRDNKILMKNNTPYQQYVDRGHFIVKVNIIEISKGEPINTTTTYVTFKGISAIILLLKKLGHKPCEVKS